MRLFSNKTKNNGFTLIETIVAIFILSLTIGALLTLTAGGIYSIRYARNQIVADNLVQESLEYIHNSRDTAALSGMTWTDWLQTLNVSESGTPVDMDIELRGCLRDNGCVVDPYTTSDPIRECTNDCPPVLFFPSEGFYGYDSFYPFGDVDSIITSYVRTVNVFLHGEVLEVQVRIEWLNGLTPKSVEQTTMLTNWHI